MKELNIIEASNMSVGTEFKLKIDCYYSYDDACRIRDNTKLIIKKVRDGFEFEEYQKLEPITTTLLNAKFIPIQKPVSFDYAISKGLEGKRIKVDVTKLNEEYSDEYTCVLNNAWNNVYYSIERIFEMLSKATYRKEIIKEGEWYVEE